MWMKERTSGVLWCLLLGSVQASCYSVVGPCSEVGSVRAQKAPAREYLLAVTERLPVTETASAPVVETLPGLPDAVSRARRATVSFPLVCVDAEAPPECDLLARELKEALPRFSFEYVKPESGVLSNLSASTAQTLGADVLLHIRALEVGRAGSKGIRLKNSFFASNETGEELSPKEVSTEEVSELEEFTHAELSSIKPLASENQAVKFEIESEVEETTSGEMIFSYRGAALGPAPESARAGLKFLFLKDETGSWAATRAHGATDVEAAEEGGAPGLSWFGGSSSGSSSGGGRAAPESEVSALARSLAEDLLKALVGDVKRLPLSETPKKTSKGSAAKGDAKEGQK